MMLYRFTSILFSTVVISCCLATATLAQADGKEKISTWEYVTGFSVNGTEDYMVISMPLLGKEKLFESYFSDGAWGEAKAIESINTYLSEQPATVTKPFLSADGKKLYYQADFSDSEGGFDIYYSNKTPNGWSTPINIGKPINTNLDELSPSITPGEDALFFSRPNPNQNFKKPRGTQDCEIIYRSLKGLTDLWESPEPVHDEVNKGCECSPTISYDGKTLYYSSIDQNNYKQGYSLYNAQILFGDFWRLPLLIEEAQNKGNSINPQFVNGSLYFLDQTLEKSGMMGSIYRTKIEADLQPLNTIKSTGIVRTLADKNPVQTALKVFEPTTLKPMGTFYSDGATGEYQMLLLDGLNYLVEVRNQGSSFASFMVDYTSDKKLYSPELIEVFDSIQLDLSVYDKVIYKPLMAKVVAEDASDKSWQTEAKMLQPGLYRFTLPLGKNYNISASAEWFADSLFLFKLEGDIVFSRFVRELPLAPKRKMVDIKIFDSESEETLAGDVLIRNLNRDEVIVFSASDIKDGKVSAMLREGDQYEFTVQGGQGYSFFNQVVDLATAETNVVEAELVSLKSQTSIRLNNITFGFNSSDLDAESFPELDRVVTLIANNPHIQIEIAAHTDNIGNASYNQRLSEKRAQSVVAYLIDNNVHSDRLIAKGYGLAKPLVPNDTEENRTLNRRVEFNILDIVEEE